MKCYCIVSAFVILVLMITVVWAKHKGRRLKDHHHKHVQILNVKHLRHSKSHKTLAAHHGHMQFKGHHRPAALKCRRVKFIVNRNMHLRKKTTDAMKRRMSKKHTKRMLHKFITSRKHKRFHLPKETRLFEDKEGNLVTYIEDCVSSENPEKKNFFEGQKELFIAPAFGERKTEHVHHSPQNNDVTTVQASEDDVGDEGIIPASEDSLLQTVSDSTEILKDSAQKEGTAQYLNDQHETEVPSNFATIFQAATLDNPLPKKPEEGSELQGFFSSNGLTNMPQLNSDVVTPISQQPLNNLVHEHDEQLSLPTSVYSGHIFALAPTIFKRRIPYQPAPQSQAYTQVVNDAGIKAPLRTRGDYVTNPAPQSQAYTQVVNDARIRAPLRNHGGYGNPLRDPEITHARFIQNAGGNQVQTFSEAFDQLHNEEQQELASYTNDNVRVPQTLGEAMNVEKAEASYENTFENLYGKDNSIGQQKGAAFLPQKQT
ncbi:hypothetical protein OS493_024778 [Desmophyllum pertusum]|uniref:Uncharacterized protein n=1 Tax=Desmophyllum pertusum TaxID=174260 RepID=A0A9W9ZCI8_9CNID|nr:hypothetical protein OS493_024778 [Desmophyllum pertusum]